jgi:hypothetical protein
MRHSREHAKLYQSSWWSWRWRRFPWWISRWFGGAGAGGDPLKAGFRQAGRDQIFFPPGKSLLKETHTKKNLKLEAVKGLFNKTQKLFVHGDQAKQMLLAIDFVKEFGFDVVIVGGSESYQIADLLKQNNIAVILGPEHHFLQWKMMMLTSLTKHRLLYKKQVCCLR